MYNVHYTYLFLIPISSKMFYFFFCFIATGVISFIALLRYKLNLLTLFITFELVRNTHNFSGCITYTSCNYYLHFF